MSLKAFHLVFISCSILLAAGFGAWLLNTYLETESPRWLWFGVASFLVAAVLVVYEIIFLKKTRNIGYL